MVNPEAWFLLAYTAYAAAGIAALLWVGGHEQAKVHRSRRRFDWRDGNRQ
jgi:hypothetical protein